MIRFNLKLRIRREKLPIVEEVRVSKDDNETFSRARILIGRKEMIVSLGKCSAIRWDTFCFIKGGGINGIKSTTITVACQDQIIKAQSLIADAFGTDTEVLEPGYYSKGSDVISVKRLSIRNRVIISLYGFSTLECKLVSNGIQTRWTGARMKIMSTPVKR